jgi:hypothetical protein
LSGSFAGSGSYQITLAKTGSPVTTSPGDEGGPLPSGLSFGSLELGDLDLWTIAANAGGNLIVTMEEIVPGSTLTPELRLYSPTGTQLKLNFGPSGTQVSATAPVTGTYLVVASDNSGGFAGTGTYRLTPASTTAVAVGSSLPTSVALASPAPNPFAGSTVLHYALPIAGSVRLRLFDVQGRCVRTLVNEQVKAPGQYEVAWDGLDAQGHALGAGVYFARLSAAGRTELRKVMIER